MAGMPHISVLRLSQLSLTCAEMSRRSAAIDSMAAELQPDLYTSPLRMALTVPGVLHVEKSAAQIVGANALRSFEVNHLGLTVDEASATFLPTKSSQRFPISESESGDDESGFELPSPITAARVNSISDNGTGGWYSYHAGKAAVFQFGESFDLPCVRGVVIELWPSRCILARCGQALTMFTWEVKSRDTLEPDDAT